MLLRRWTVVDRPRSLPPHVLHSRETDDAGHPGARPIVLVHGSGTTSRYFRPLLRKLDARGLPASAVELPGIGSSSAHDVPRDVASLADVLAAWLRTTGRWPTTLVGNSMGSQVVTEVAVRHPELVDGLVLVGPTVDRRARNFGEQAAKLLLDATRERPSLVATVATDTFLTSRKAVWLYIAAALRHRLEERLPLVQVPVLIVRGERDPMVPRRWCERLVTRAQRGLLIEVPDAAHGTHHGAPGAVADLIAEVHRHPNPRPPSPV